MTPDDVPSLKVVDLRNELQARGLDTHGLKSQLVQRLMTCLEREAEEEMVKQSKQGKRKVDEVIDEEENDEISMSHEVRESRASPRPKRNASPAKRNTSPAKRNASPSKTTKDKSPLTKAQSPQAKPASPLKKSQSPEIRASSDQKEKSPLSKTILPSSESHESKMASPKVSAPIPNETNSKSEIHQNSKSKRRRKKKTVVAAVPTMTSERDTESVEVEYVPANLFEANDPIFQEYASVFEHFQTGGVRDHGVPSEVMELDENQQDNEESNDVEMSQSQPLSKRKAKLLSRMSVAQLKQQVEKPEVVEWVDVTAADPKLLVALKSLRNTIPVPIHWCQKRRYLQNKRGTEKVAFDLPAFIKETGIMEMRQPNSESERSLKSKTRDRMQPKLGRLDIDYEKLHDAFFRHQTKPFMTRYGDIYYEGKEFEAKLKDLKPGQLSDELRIALGIPPGAPPPWLMNMQRFGPPPAYPFMKIPGLNAPIPVGAQWGFHPGGWGKPPVDEMGRPLYGDVFGEQQEALDAVHTAMMASVDKTRWAELLPEEIYIMEEEQEVQEEENEAVVVEEKETTPIEQPLTKPQAVIAPLTAASVTTDEPLELRKKASNLRATAAQFMDVSEKQPELYKVLPERSTAITGFMGSQHAYDISAKRKLESAGVETPQVEDASAAVKRKKTEKKDFKF